MAANIQRYFDITLTQGAADAFVEDSIQTNLEPADGLAYVITRMEVLRRQVINGTSGFLEWSVCRDSKTAVAKYDDDECVYSDGFGVLTTTSGRVLDRLRTEVMLPQPIFVVEPRIWVQFDSNGTSLSNVVDFRFHYETQKLTEVEILRLLNNV